MLPLLILCYCVAPVILGIPLSEYEYDYESINYVDIDEENQDLVLLKSAPSPFTPLNNAVLPEVTTTDGYILQDVRKLYEQLPNAQSFLVPHKHFSHLDFVWGKDVDTLLYNRILSRMEVHRKNL